MGWRLYTKKDEPAVALLHAAMIERVGENFELPTLDERPILIALVYEDDAKMITHAAFLETQAEFCAMGDGALPRKEWKEANRMCTEVCRMYAIQYVRSFVPSRALGKTLNSRPSAVERMLRAFGFVREDLTRITPFTRRMA